MPADDRSEEVTRLLADLARGEPVAELLFPLVYEELRDLASAQLRREKPGHTLQPTALVHEAFLKLAGQERARFESRSHFLAIAATAMRRVLVHHAEKRGSQKRGGGRAREATGALDAVVAPDAGEAVDLLALDEALTRLAALDERKAKVVELRYFAGLSVEEVAEAQGSSPATVKRDWEFARAWLLRELSRGDTT
ncbi:MAG: sigma-70 family RNA polymerase sigma factor [Planctomycetes bacterium]|nr:sigma-70 family RNA polymerase sigma factor [Planctomycetota bacterium]